VILRRPMVEALSAIDPALVSDEPLFGIGIVAPSDTLNISAGTKATLLLYSRTTQMPKNSKRSSEELPTDDEKDFGGDDVR
jgi:hypothetical protein